MPGAPTMDFVVTVCDKAATKVPPVWPGHPLSAHWGVEDPAAFVGAEDEVRVKLKAVLSHLSRCIELFLSLPLASTKGRVDRVGVEIDRRGIQQSGPHIDRQLLRYSDSMND